jgi:hypothetical protein
MAGDFWLSRDARWVVNNSLYHWALEFLISSLDDQPGAGELEKIRDANLGLVNLADFDPGVQRDILGLLRDKLVEDAVTRLPPDMPGRESFISGLQNLADLAGRSLNEAS